MKYSKKIPKLFSPKIFVTSRSKRRNYTDNISKSNKKIKNHSDITIDNSNIKKIKENEEELKTFKINIKKDDLFPKQKQFHQISNFENNIFPQNKKLIFLVHKRKHSEDDTIEQNNKKKKPLYKKHDKYEKDNILSKIQIHYKNFLKSFINEIIKKIILEESYISKNLYKIIHLNEYLFNNIDHKFKSNIKKEIMKMTETIKIKDIMSPSEDFCKKYNIENRNSYIMRNIELMKNPILNKILNCDYLYFFNLYYESKRNINLKEGDANFNFDLNQNIEFFNDLINKEKNDNKYISKLKKVAISNFAKNSLK